MEGFLLRFRLHTILPLFLESENNSVVPMLEQTSIRQAKVPHRILSCANVGLGGILKEGRKGKKGKKRKVQSKHQKSAQLAHTVFSTQQGG
eukprot:scaffold22566_cov138-Cylindrotheca_fusiformis.AAC.2